MWIYYNLFQPVLHLKEKLIVHQNGQRPRTRRRYDQARTPFDRLCATDVILPQHQARLTGLRDRINPRLLRQQIYTAIDQLFSLPGATPGTVEDVYQTLLYCSDSPVASVRLTDLVFNRTPIVDGAP
jgi:hypothetical protein